MIRCSKRCRSSQNLFVLSVLLGFLVGPLIAANDPPSSDRVKTQKGDLVIHPLDHATLIMEWGQKAIYVDPVGGAQRYQRFSKPRLVLITDVHRDHLSIPTLKAVVGQETTVVAPRAVAESLEGAGLKTKTIRVIANGESATVDGFKIAAIPMYNVTKDRLRYHTKGRGNGYVLEAHGTRVYISGDTEDIPEMRRLKDIDVAFVCMNLPYTMTPAQAASAVLEFKPKIVYPYHYRGQDTAAFKSMVEAKSKAIDVRLRNWYKPE